MGAQTGKKKNGDSFYKVDLYAPGVGAFDKTVTPDEYVRFAALAPATPLSLSIRLTVREEKIPLPGGGSFSVRRLALDMGDLALPENARSAKAS